MKILNMWGFLKKNAQKLLQAFFDDDNLALLYLYFWGNTWNHFINRAILPFNLHLVQNLDWNEKCGMKLYNEANDNDNLLSRIRLCNYYIYITREKLILNIDYLISNLMKVKKRDKQISLATSNKIKAYKKYGTLQITFYQ